MKQFRFLFPILALLLLVGCADSDSQPPKKKHAMVGTGDSQFTNDAAMTNTPPPPDGTNADTNSMSTNDVANPANPFPTATPVPAPTPHDLPMARLFPVSRAL